MPIKNKLLLQLNPYQQYLNLKTKLFLQNTKNPIKTQKQLLKKIIKQNKNSNFGKDNNFKEIKSITNYTKYVKINKYKNLKPYIDSSIQGNTNTIITTPIEYYSITSGTTNYPKYIPHTKNYIKKLNIGWGIWFNKVFQDFPTTISLLGGLLTFNSKAYEGYTINNTGYGNVSGLLHHIQPFFIQSLYATPDEIYDIKNFKLTYYLISIFSLKKDVRIIITPNPSTLLSFAKEFNKNIPQMISDLKNNTIQNLENNKTINKQTKSKLLKKFQKNPKQNKKIAQILENLHSKKTNIYPKDYFKNLKVIGCWTGGNVGIYIKKLPKYYGNTNIREIGYMASEGRLSIPLGGNQEGEGILDIKSNFYEFININDIGKKYKKTKFAWELEKNEKYYILITNENGLYRYFIDDIIQVTNFYNKTPIIKFLQKGTYFSSITGEKISEWEIINILNTTSKELEFEYITFFVIPTITTQNPHYTYYIEFNQRHNSKFIEHIEKELESKLKQQNIEYKSKRETYRLKPIKIKQLPKNSFNKLKKEFTKNKTTDTQTKVPKLIVTDKDKQKIKNTNLI